MSERAEARLPSAAFDDLEIDFAAREVRCGGVPVELTKSEYALLAELARHPGRAIRDRDLLAAMWGRAWHGDTAPLTVHVSRLRRKLGESGSRPRHIRTVTGFGYRFDPAPAPQVALPLSVERLAELDAATGRPGSAAYALVDLENTILWVSESITDLVGWAPEDLVGVCVHDLALDEERAAWVDAGAALAAGAGVDTSFSMRAPSGGHVPLHVVVRPLVGADGGVTGFLTDWSPAGAEPRTPRAAAPEPISLDPGTDVSLLRLLVAGGDVLWVYDGDGVCVWVSDSVEAYLGHPPHTLLGTRTSLLHPDDRAAALERLAEAAGQRAERIRSRVRLVAADGSVRWADSSVALQWDGDRLVRQFASLRDVTAEVEAEQRLAESERRLQLFADNVADVVVRLDGGNRPLWVSPSVQRYFGIDPEADLAAWIGLLWHPDDRERIGAGLAALRSGASEAVAEEVRMRGSDGEYGWWQVTVRRLAGDPATCELAVTLRDVDEHVRTREALAAEQRRAQQVLDALVEAHLLLSPVAPDGGEPSGWRVVGANAAACARMRLPVERLVGRHLQALFPPEGVAAITDWCAAAWREGVLRLDDAEAFSVVRGGPGRYDVRAVRVDGSVSLTVLDRTERWQARQDRDTERARLRAVLDSEPDGHLVLEALRDESGAIVDFACRDANPAACETLGRTRDELVGARLLGLLPTSPALRRAARAAVAAVVESGEPLVRDDIAFPLPALDRGRRFDLRGVRAGDGLVVTWRDVTARSEAAAALAASEARYRLMVEHTSDVVMTFDAALDATWVSESVRSLLDRPPEEMLGSRHLGLVHPDDLAVIREAARAAAETGHYRSAAFRWRRAAGDYVWVEGAGGRVVDEGGRIVGWVVRFRDIDEQVRAETALREQARTDPLTGLLNRGEALARLAAVLAHPPRAEGRPALLFLDLDGLKQVNDARGHAVGDLVLATVAGRVRDLVREGDMVARIGGDELLVVLAGVRDLTDAITVAEKIRRAAAAPVPTPDGVPVLCTVSIGVTDVRAGDDPDSLVNRADRAMYLSKRYGRDRVTAAS